MNIKYETVSDSDFELYYVQAGNWYENFGGRVNFSSIGNLAILVVAEFLANENGQTVFGTRK